MKRRTVIIPLSVAAAIVVAGLLVFYVPRLLATRLTFTFEDAVSKSWVWDATATLQGREIRSYYQSNRGPVPMTFTDLRPGKATLTIKAPNYETVRIPLHLHIGHNVISQPVKMVGYRIPGLKHITMFETQTSSGLSVQVRPIDAAGHAITTLPCLNLWIGALVSTEMNGGKPAETTMSSGATRGPVLYRGKIKWTWDPAISKNFHYNATIPYAELANKSASYLVIDYLVIVPDPRKMTQEQVSAMMSAAPHLTSTNALQRYLDAKRGDNRFEYFLTTSWNVPGPAANAGAGS